MVASIVRLFALALCIGNTVASDMQAASCAVKCSPVKQNYCAIDGLVPTYSTSYTSQCNCLVAKCKNKKVQCLTKGICNPLCLKKIDPTKCPPGVVRPVCGSNGVTYDNLCYLKAARCINSDIQFLTPGKCPSKLTSCGVNKCTTTKSKVCGSVDGKTILKFQNDCFLTAASCVNPKIKPTTCPGKSLRNLGLTLTTPPVTTKAPGKATTPTLPTKTSATASTTAPSKSTKSAAKSKSGSKSGSSSGSSDADLADDLGSFEIPIDVSDTDEDILITDDLMSSDTVAVTDSSFNGTASSSNDMNATISTTSPTKAKSSSVQVSVAASTIIAVFVARLV